MARTSAAIWPTTWRSDALDHDLGLRRALDLDAGRHLLHHRMRIADLQVQLLALRLRTKADADQRQAALEALADAVDHVGHQRAHRAAHGVGLGRLVGRREAQLAGLVAEADQRVQRARQRAERTLDADALVLDRHVHALRHGDRHFSYAGHCLALLRVRPRSTALRRRCRRRAPCDRSSRPAAWSRSRRRGRSSPTGSRGGPCRCAARGG